MGLQAGNSLTLGYPPRGGVPVCACMHVRALRGCSSLALWLGEHPFSSLPVSLPHPGSPSFPPSLCFLSWSLCVSLAASAGCMLAQKAPPWGGVPMAVADASHTLIHSGVLPPPPLNPQDPEKDLESPSSTRLEALVPSCDSRAMTRSPSPRAWRPDFPGAAREAP